MPDGDEIGLSLYRSVIAGGHRGVGSLSPWPVTVSTIRRAPVFPSWNSPATEAALAVADGNSFALREPALRGKNVLVANDANLAVTFLQS